MWSGRYWQALVLGELELQGGGREVIMRESCHQNFSTTQTNTTCITSWKKKKKTAPPVHYPASPDKPMLSSLPPSPPLPPSSSTSWPAHVRRTVWVSPGTVHRAPRHCVRPPPPRAAPRGAGNVRTAPGRGRSRWPRPLYRGSPAPVTSPSKSCRCLGRRQSSRSSWCQGRPLSCQRWAGSGGRLRRSHSEKPGPPRARCQCSDRTRSRSLAECHTVTGVPARRRRHQRTSSSLRASQNWPRNPSSRRRKRCSWSVNPGRCRSYSSGPSPLRFRGRIVVCNGRWVSSGQTCRQSGSLSRCASWNTRWRPSRGPSTASQHALRGEASIGCRSRRTWGCKWALVAGRPALRLSCWGTVDSRTGNIARWGISGSSLKHWTVAGRLFCFSIYSELTVLANVAVVRCYLRTKPTNISPSRRQEIHKVILGQIILCSVCYALAMSLGVCVSLLAAQL